MAECDLAAAKLLHKHGDGFAEPVGFHCQQAAEKYLKAVLVAHNLRVPKIHNLVRLIEMIKEMVPELLDNQDDAAWLSFFAVEMRYPLAPRLATTREHAQRAIKIAEHIKEICLHHLKSQ